MKVLFITSTFPAHNKDAQAPWIGELARRLVARGVELGVLAPGLKEKAQRDYYGIPVTRFRYAPASWQILTHNEGALFKLRNNKALFFLPILYILCGILATYRQVRKNHYDVVHVHWAFPQAIFGIVAKLTSQCRVVYSFYGAEFALLSRIPFGDRLLALLMPWADAVVSISTYTKRKVQRIYPSPVTVIPFSSTIHPNLRQVKHSLHVPRKTKSILYVGRLIERKGISYLIDAASIVTQKIPMRLDIIGEGPLLDALKKQVRSLSLENTVVFQGKVETHRLVEFYMNCDIFVLPAIVDSWNDTEGLGVVLLEAMRCRKAVIASRVGGIPDIITHGATGLLVEQRNPQKLAAAIIRLCKDGRLRTRLGDRGFMFSRDYFNWDRIVQKTIRIYKRT